MNEIHSTPSQWQQPNATMKRIAILAIIVSLSVLIPQPFGLGFGLIASGVWRIYRRSQGWIDPRETAWKNTFANIKGWFKKDEPAV